MKIIKNFFNKKNKKNKKMLQDEKKNSNVLDITDVYDSEDEESFRIKDGIYQDDDIIELTEVYVEPQTEEIETEEIETEEIETAEIETKKIETKKIETKKIETEKIETEKNKIEKNETAPIVIKLEGGNFEINEKKIEEILYGVVKRQFYERISQDIDSIIEKILLEEIEDMQKILIDFNEDR